MTQDPVGKDIVSLGTELRLWSATIPSRFVGGRGFLWREQVLVTCVLRFERLPWPSQPPELPAGEQGECGPNDGQATV